jgi:DNA modification methylase
MAGSGTCIDVCKEEGRNCIAYDIVPTRSDIVRNDARKLHLEEDSVDMIFVDSPYGNNIHYNDHKKDIGKISAESQLFYDELSKVIVECHRVLKPGKILGWVIGDQWVKKRFTPVGFNLYMILQKYFDTVDVVCVVRHKQASNMGKWSNRALIYNFYLRGFKYLFIMRKSSGTPLKTPSERSVRWKAYSRINFKETKE